MWQLEAVSGEGDAGLDGMRWTGKRSDAAIELSTAWGVAIIVGIVVAVLDLKSCWFVQFECGSNLIFIVLELKSCQHFENLPQIVRKAKAIEKKQSQWPSKCWFICPSHGCHTLLDPSRLVCCILFYFLVFWLAAKIFEIFCFRLAKFAAANGVLQRSGMQASEIHQRIIKFAVTYGVLASPRLPKECAVATEKK